MSIVGLAGLLSAEFNDYEANVNGAWNATLSSYFRFNHAGTWENNWTIYPEAFAPMTTQGRKADLVVGWNYLDGQHQNHYTMRVVYEGKKRTGDNFQLIAGQLRDYMQDCHFSKTDQPLTWMMGARGCFAAFWIWDVTRDGNERLLNVKDFDTATNTPEFVNKVTVPFTIKEWDVTTEEAKVRGILAYMAAHPTGH